MHNFTLINCDTDSIMVSKPDGTPFSNSEQDKLLDELNNLFPKKIHWELEDTFRKVIILKAKNYILQKEDGKITYKGSSLKDQKTETALKEFKYEIIGTILDEKFDYVTIYNKYVKEILNLTDIKRWSSKKTLSETTYTSQRTNETKIIDAIKGTEYKQNDRIWVYFDKDQNLKLVENYNNDHDIMTLVKKLFTTSRIFDNIISKGTFTNFALKKNQGLLQEFK